MSEETKEKTEPVKTNKTKKAQTCPKCKHAGFNGKECGACGHKK